MWAPHDYITRKKKGGDWLGWGSIDLLMDVCVVEVVCRARRGAHHIEDVLLLVHDGVDALESFLAERPERLGGLRRLVRLARIATRRAFHRACLVSVGALPPVA